MLLESARELKQALLESAPNTEGRVVVRTRGIPREPQPPVAAADNAPIALGITRQRHGEYVLAVRVQSRSERARHRIEDIRRQACAEVDVRFVGRIVRRSGPWFRRANRPLLIGGSLGHSAAEAGTLGCFVRDRATQEVLVLSNNHVLARENLGSPGDAILQPARADGGRESRHTVGRLERFISLASDGVNHVDAALASLQDVESDHCTLTEHGRLAGLGEPFLDEGTEVAKIGRTTGISRGRVTAFEVDNVGVWFDQGYLRFDRQVEIEGVGSEPFSRAGDSGSLIVDAGCLAVGLLFAGTDFGGANGEGLTYANPLALTLDTLAVDLLS